MYHFNSRTAWSYLNPSKKVWFSSFNSRHSTKSFFSIKLLLAVTIATILTPDLGGQCPAPTSFITTSSGSGTCNYTSTFSIDERNPKDMSVLVSVWAGEVQVHTECTKLVKNQNAFSVSYSAPCGSVITAFYQSFLANKKASCIGADICDEGSCDANGNCASSSGQTLPISLLSFEAKMSDGNVEINWATSLEINNSHFEVDRSSNGIIWQSLAIITGNESSQQVNSYSITDYKPFSATSFYRLSQFDLDGTRTAFPVVSVKVPIHNDVDLSFNPVKRTLIVHNAKQNSRLHIFNFQGQKVWQTPLSDLDALIDLDMLLGGNYILVYISEQERKSKSIYLMH